MTAANPNGPAPLPREEVEDFLHVFTHELRNRLNSIALEATDLAEQAGPQADSSRLQRQVRECSAFLKNVRDLLTPDDPQAKKIALPELVKKLRERKL